MKVLSTIIITLAILIQTTTPIHETKPKKSLKNLAQIFILKKLRRIQKFNTKGKMQGNYIILNKKNEIENREKNLLKKLVLDVLDSSQIDQFYRADKQIVFYGRRYRPKQDVIFLLKFWDFEKFECLRFKTGGDGKMGLIASGVGSSLKEVGRICKIVEKLIG